MELVSGNVGGETLTSASLPCLTLDSGQVCYVFLCSVSPASFSLLQIGTQNSLEILEDPKAEVVDEIAAKLGLRKVWMMVDLVCLAVAVRKVLGGSLQPQGVNQSVGHL